MRKNLTRNIKEKSSVFETGVDFNKKWFLYVDHTADTLEHFYVGKGNFNRTQCYSRNEKHYAVSFAHGLLRKVILSSDDEQEILDNEIKKITELRTYVYGENPVRYAANFTLGGEGLSGYKHPPEKIAQFRELNSGSKNAMFGKRHTSESIFKNVENNKKHWQDPNFRKKRCEQQKEIVNKPAYRFKKKSRLNRKIATVDQDDRITCIFFSGEEFAKFLGVKRHIPHYTLKQSPIKPFAVLNGFKYRKISKEEIENPIEVSSFHTVELNMDNNFKNPERNLYDGQRLKVWECDLSGNFLFEHPSLISAAKAANHNRLDFTHILLGKISAEKLIQKTNRIWKYAPGQEEKLASRIRDKLSSETKSKISSKLQGRILDRSVYEALSISKRKAVIAENVKTGEKLKFVSVRETAKYFQANKNSILHGIYHKILLRNEWKFEYQDPTHYKSL